MGNAKQSTVCLVVEDEQKLYTPFSPEVEFSEAVKNYIRAKIASKDPRHSIRLKVMSRDPLDEARFRSAVSNWVLDESAIFQMTRKDLIRLLIERLILGSALIVLSLALEKQFEVLKYTLIPVMSSLALSKAAGILILELPTNAKYKKLLKEMEESSVITFEYGTRS